MNRRTFFKALLVTPAAVAAVVKAEAAPKPRTLWRPYQERLIFTSTPGDNDGHFYNNPVSGAAQPRSL